MPSQVLPLFGMGVGTKSPAVSEQFRTNMYVERYGEPDKAQIAYFARPGTTANYVNITNTSVGGIFAPGGPWRGVSQSSVSALAGNPNPFGFYDGRIYLALGNQLCFMQAGVLQVATVGGLSATYPTSTGPVRFADNGFQIISVDGTGGLILGYPGINPSVSTSLQGITNFPAGAKTVCFLAGYFICDDPSAAGQFRWSNLNDGTTWQALNFANAESNPDPLVACFASRGQLFLFGTRTIEYWQPSGTSTFFQAVTSAVSNWGCYAIDSIKEVGDQVICLARGAGGRGTRQVISIQGYTPTVISNPDVEADIDADPTPDQATAVQISIAGHLFYVLNLTAKSWVYDTTTQNWDVWSTAGGRFAGQYSAILGGQTLLSDYRDSRFYSLSTSVFLDDAKTQGVGLSGSTLSRQVTSRHVFNNGDWTTIDELVIEFEPGTGQNAVQGNPVPQTTTGVIASNTPQAMLQWSRDGGRTFGNEIWQTLGPAGGYRLRAVWRGLGRARDWIIRCTVTDPVKLVLVNAYARVRP